MCVWNYAYLLCLPNMLTPFCWLVGNIGILKQPESECQYLLTKWTERARVPVKTLRLYFFCFSYSLYIYIYLVIAVLDTIKFSSSLILNIGQYPAITNASLARVANLQKLIIFRSLIDISFRKQILQIRPINYKQINAITNLLFDSYFSQLVCH